MKRIFWVALGATAGVLVVRRLTRTAQAYTPEGLARSANGIADAIREFGDRVSIAMAQREAELRDALGVDGEHDLPPEVAAQLIENPTSEWRNGR